MKNSLKSARISFVTPAFNESKNLPILYRRLVELGERETLNWEWIIVDDRSTDETFSVIETLAATDSRIRGYRLSRNCGSHIAVSCALHHAQGDCAILMAGDLEDSCTTALRLLTEWYRGFKVVWASRGRRPGIGLFRRLTSRVYFSMVQKLMGLSETPVSGADCGLFDRVVIDAVKQCRETHVSLFMLITWMGFSQTTLVVDKEERIHGRSGWTLEKKIKLVLDSVVSFSYLPIRLMSYLGFLIACLGGSYATYLVWNAFTGTPPSGWSSLMISILLLGGATMLMLGILGEYLWRALAEARHRPMYWVEQTVGEASEQTPPLERLLESSGNY